MNNSYPKSNLLFKGKARRIVIEFEDSNACLVVLDGEEAESFLADWTRSLSKEERREMLKERKAQEEFEVSHRFKS